MKGHEVDLRCLESEDKVFMLLQKIAMTLVLWKNIRISKRQSLELYQRFS